MFAIPKVKSQKDAKKGKTKTECQFFVITSDKALLRKKKPPERIKEQKRI